MEVFLVSTDETAVLEQIALGETMHSQRAQALLRLAESESFTEAAAQSGLSENQVKYWVGRFRTRRLTIFPDDLVTAVSEEVTSATDLGGEIVVEKHSVVEQEIELEEGMVIVEPADVDKWKKKKKKSKGKKKKDKNKTDIKKAGKKDKKKKKEGKQKSAKKKDDKKKKGDSKQKIDKKKKKHSDKKKSKKKKKLDDVKKSNKGKSKKSKKKAKKNK